MRMICKLMLSNYSTNTSISHQITQVKYLLSVPAWQHMTATSLAALQPLSGLNLVLPATTNHFKITLLIGEDYDWDIIKDQIIRGNDPIEMQSKLPGYLLSGQGPHCQGVKILTINGILHAATQYTPDTSTN